MGTDVLIYWGTSGWKGSTQLIGPHSNKIIICPTDTYDHSEPACNNALCATELRACRLHLVCIV